MGVRGTDGTTFGPLLDKSSTLWVFEPDAMRSLPLVYSEVGASRLLPSSALRAHAACLRGRCSLLQLQTVLGLPAMRFVGRDDAFPDCGGINLTNTATIRVRAAPPVLRASSRRALVHRDARGPC